MKTLLFLFLLTSVCYAANIDEPPPTETGIYNYLKQVKKNIHTIPVTTTNPDGTRVGKVGDMVLYQIGGTNYLEICVVASSNSWEGVALQ